MHYNDELRDDLNGNAAQNHFDIWLVRCPVSHWINITVCILSKRKKQQPKPEKLPFSTRAGFYISLKSWKNMDHFHFHHFVPQNGGFTNV